MQKKSFFLLFSLLFLWGMIFLSSFTLDREYDYARIVQKIKLIWEDYIPVKVNTDMNSWVLALDARENHLPSHIVWVVDWKNYIRTLDLEDQDSTWLYYTFPLVTDSRSDIQVTLIGWDISEAFVIAENTLNYHTRVRLHPPILRAKDAITIVSRKSWWADESLRYVNEKFLSQKINDWEARSRMPLNIYLTESDVIAKDKETKISEVLQSLHPESFSVVKRVRYDNWKKLIWPLKYSKIVDRIVIHHTAETPEQANSDDKTVMRSIYSYHARTRGWGDIGYQYIIGKDGTVYEWRTGGDYVEGAHAYANNLWTVWVSLMGNFDKEVVPRAQLASLENVLVYLAQKYGINVAEKTTWFRVCGKNSPSDCVIETIKVNRLHAHRDVGYTSCPWVNLYSQLDWLRESVASKVWKVIPMENKQYWPIDPVPWEDMVNYIYPLNTSTSKPQPLKSTIDLNLIQPTISLWGRLIRIKLSYPDVDNINLSIASKGIPNIRVDSKKLFWKQYSDINIWKVWNDRLIVNIGDKVYSWSSIEYSAPVVRIDSWSRIPIWDKAQKYNDNLFRSKVIIRNTGWKLLVVNELPLEDYLRGLGEVSDSDNPEKIKVITIAARSYARFYMLSKNRKYNTSLYDWSDDPDSFQKYLGYSYESRSPNVSREVKNTLWQVITYKWDIIKAWYFSQSSGRTLSYKEYCEKNTWKFCIDIPYLQSVPDIAWSWTVQSWHGVGISWIGATAMARDWKTYKQIIQYYLKWVEIRKK